MEGAVDEGGRLSAYGVDVYGSLRNGHAPKHPAHYFPGPGAHLHACTPEPDAQLDAKVDALWRAVF